MRTPIYVLIAALFFGGCTHYHVTPAGAPSRPDRVQAPAPEPVEPLELDIGRPIGSQLLLQTNRPAYVAIFEIIPNRGVTLIYPAAAHQQNMLVSGLTWVPLWWSPKRVSITSDRYIYAVASEEPLRLSGETFHVGYFHRVLGLSVYAARNPYSTMRAISREIVPNVAEEEWAEDVHVLTPMYHTETYRTARIYCTGGRVFEVPEDMVARIWCPTRARVVIVDVTRPRSRDYPVGRPARPDSVYGQGGVRVRLEPRRPRGPIARVVDPTGRDRDDRGVGRGRDVRDERDDRDERDERRDQDEKPEKERRGGRIKDLIDAKKEQQEREREERERQRHEAEEARREAEEARRREAEERKAEREQRQDERREEREARKDERDERKDERKDERDARKQEREERKEARKEEPQQQGQPQEEKREEKREETRDDNKRRGSIKDMIKEQKEKEQKEKEQKEKEKKDKP